MDEHSSSQHHFSIIPHWIIFSGVSSGAIHLYAVLAKYADWESGEAFPARSTLAKDLGKSPDTVDRHLKELKDIGAITIEARHRKGTKENRSNKYTLIGSRTVAATLGARVRPGSRMDAAENDNHITTTTSNENHNPPPGDHSTSEQSSDERHFTSNSQANQTRQDILSKDHWKHLRSKLQEVGKAIQQTGSFHSELAQDKWDDFIFSLELVTDHLDFSDVLADLTQNGKWTVNHKVATEYEAGKELLTLLNTARAAA